VAPSRFLDYQTKTPLRLPFDGAWFVVWGGRTLAQNRHASSPDQRFAYDIVVQKGTTHQGDGTTNEQYYAFGQPILAAGAGTVRMAADGVPDNVPGKVDEVHPAGNHVIIDHGNGEFSFYAHLKMGTVRIKPGQHVEQGEILGLCGNSGRSTEPHLHFHLQTTAQPFQGEGLPAFFLNYVADGKPVERGEPVQGQTVAVK
jgi:hypothetical protein